MRLSERANTRSDLESVARKVRGKTQKTALRTADFVNLAAPGKKVVKTKITKVLENPTNNDFKEEA